MHNTVRRNSGPRKDLQHLLLLLFEPHNHIQVMILLQSPIYNCFCSCSCHCVFQGALLAIKILNFPGQSGPGDGQPYNTSYHDFLPVHVLLNYLQEIITLYESRRDLLLRDGRSFFVLSQQNGCGWGQVQQFGDGLQTLDLKKLASNQV